MPSDKHQKKMQAILDVAARLIVERGYENVSLREIAQQAEYSPASLYEYFQSKDDILFALGARVNAQLISALQAVPTQNSPTANVIELSRAYTRFALENPKEFQLMSALPGRRKSLDEPVGPESAYFLILQAVQAGLETGDFQPREGFAAEEITYSLWVLMHGMAMLQLTHLKNFPADFERIDRVAIGTFIDGLGKPAA